MNPKKIIVSGFLCAIFATGLVQAQTAITYDLDGNRSSQASVAGSVAPNIIAQPITQIGQVGGSYAFSVVAGGPGPFTYQWYENGMAINGATSATLFISNAQAGNFTDHGTGANSYYVTVTNSVATVTSNTAALYLDTDGTGMADWWQIQYFGSIGVAPGADADGDGVTNLQEYLDGTDPTNAASRAYTLTVTGPAVVQPLLPRYPAGSVVTLSALSGDGSYFQNWAGDASGQQNPLTVVIEADMKITAVTSAAVTPPAAPLLSASSNLGGNVSSVLVQSDGHILVAGGFHTLNGRPQWDLGRLNADGSLDTTFFAGAGAELPFSGLQEGVSGMVQQADGKIIVVGFSTGFRPAPCIYRINTDGTIDTTFAASSATFVQSYGEQGQVTAVALQSDGKILIGGEFDTVGGVAAGGMARLNADGSLDNTFNAGGAGLTVNGNFGSVTSGCLLVDANGLIYLAGNFDSYDGTPAPGLARLNNDGSLDTSFNAGNALDGTNSLVSVIIVRPGNGVVAGGSFTDINENSLPAVVAFTSTGSVDPGFNAPQNVFGAASLALQSNGQILVGVDFGMARLNTDGTLDASFSASFGGIGGTVSTIAVQDNGQIIAGGIFSTADGVPRNDLARLNADGTLDASAITNAASAPAYFFSKPALAEQPDGKVIVGGDFSQLDNSTISYLARLNSDSSLDLTFDGGGAGPDGSVSSVIVAPNGKILVSGAFFHYNGFQAMGYVQLNSDGTIDPTFTPGRDRTVSPAVTQAVRQADGKFVLAGPFQNFTVHLERINTDGTVDGTYAPQLDGSVTAEALQTDGKLLIGGQFRHVNGQPVAYFARLNADGSLDATFQPPTITDTVTLIALQPGGQILVSVQGTPFQRLNADGSADPTYANLLNYLQAVSISAVSILPDGSAFLGGTFAVPPSLQDQFGSLTQYCVKVTSQGVLDLSFKPGLNAPALAILGRSNGEVYAAGAFSTDSLQNAVGLVWYSAAPNLILSPVSVSIPGPIDTGITETLIASASAFEGDITSVVFQVSTDNVNFTTVALGASSDNYQYTAQWTPSTEGIYYLRTLATDTLSNTGASVVVSNFVVSNSAPPQINTQPFGGVVTLGTPVSFTVAASGSGTLSYQWQFNNAPLSGQTGATLNLGNVTQSEAGNYTVVVHNAFGNVTSEVVILTVQATFSQWEAIYGFNGDPTGTPQNDGVSNLLKYLYDINPTRAMTTADRGALPAIGTTGGQLTLTYRQNSLLTGVTVNVQDTFDLSFWQAAFNPFITQIGTDPVTGDPIMQVQVPMIGSQEFIRLYITSP